MAVEKERGVMLGYIWCVRRADDHKTYTITNEGNLIPMEMMKLGAQWSQDPHDFPALINFVKPAIKKNFEEYQATLEEWEEPHSAYMIEVCRVIDRVALSDRYKPILWQSVNATGQFFNGMTKEFEEIVTRQCEEEHREHRRAQAVYLKEMFPFWMGHFPGGIHYDSTRTLEELVDELGPLTRDLINYASRHSLGPGGGLKLGKVAGAEMSGSVILHKARYGSGLRKLRNSWKISCAEAGLPSNDELWRVLPQVLGEAYVQEWKEFAEAVELYLAARNERKEKAC
jgi:hypothetical protein